MPAPGQQAAVVTMELDDDALPRPRGRDLQAAPAAVPRGQLLRRHAAGQPERPLDRRRPHLPDQPDLVLGPARPGADHAAGRCPRRPADVPRTSSATRSPSTAARRASASSTGPRRRRSSTPPQVNQAVLGTPARRPHRADPRPRSGRPRARQQRAGAAGPGHQLPRLLRLVRGRGRGAWARRSRCFPTSLRSAKPAFANLNARLPGAARVRARGAPRRALDAGDAAPPRLRSSSRCGCWSRSASCAG